MTGVEHNRPDVVVIERNVRKWTLIDFSVLMDQNVDSKEGEKTGKYSDLAREIRREYKVHTYIMPVVLGAFVRNRSKDFSRESEEVRHPRCDRMPADNCTSWHGVYPQKCAEHPMRSDFPSQ